MTTNALKKQKGFTIIEVVLVLAIAGLIFLIVFLALPQLQKSRRDTQRRNDAGRIISGLENYAASNDGKYPTGVTGSDGSTNVNQLVGNFLDGNLKDPSTGSAYSFVGSAPTAVGQIQYAAGSICDGTSVTATGASSRNIALLMKLESGLYCRSNQ